MSLREVQAVTRNHATARMRSPGYSSIFALFLPIILEQFQMVQSTFYIVKSWVPRKSVSPIVRVLGETERDVPRVRAAR